MSKDSVNVAFNATYDYDAFGNLTENTGGEADNNPFRYNGQYTDDETGLLYLRNRYYDPSIGRFTQEDTYWNVNNMIYGNKQPEEKEKGISDYPILYNMSHIDRQNEFETRIPDYSAIDQSANLYVYCMGDPIQGIDPTGKVAYEHFSTLEDAIQDWAWNNCGYTRVTGNEKGAALYYGYDENGSLFYSYTWSNVGGDGYCDPQSVQNDRPDNTNLLGYIHSHYKYNFLSRGDYDLAQSTGLSVYMVYAENGTGKVDVYRKTRYGYSEHKNVYKVYGYAPWTYGADLCNREGKGYENIL